MKVTNIVNGLVINRPIEQGEVKHGDIIKFVRTDNGIKTEKTGTVQYIFWNSRFRRFEFYTEKFEANTPSYSRDSHLGTGEDELIFMGHEPSDLDTAIVGDHFEAGSRGKYTGTEKFTKYEDKWWVGRREENGEEILTMYTENTIRESFREDSRIVLVRENSSSSFEKQLFNVGDWVCITPHALSHDSFRNFPGVAKYMVVGVHGESIHIRTENNITRYIVHQSHLMKDS